MTFDGKIAAYEELINRKYPAEFDKKYSKLFLELRYIRGVRNSVAHWPVYTSYSTEDKIPKEFSLLNFRNGAGKKVFSKGDFALFQSRINKSIEVVNSIA
jgi:aminoglycoside phosphotransferase (APT) family kinase protein